MFRINKVNYQLNSANIKNQTKCNNRFFRQLSTLPKESFKWCAPNKNEIFHPADIFAFLLKNSSLEGSINGYINLEDHMTGVGIGATMGEECASIYGGARTHQNKFTLHARVALSLKYPDIFNYAKSYHMMTHHFKENTQHFIFKNANELFNIDKNNLNSVETNRKIHFLTSYLLDQTISSNVIKNIEKCFGKQIKVGFFTDKEIDEVNTLSEKLTENDDIFDNNINQTITMKFK